MTQPAETRRDPLRLAINAVPLAPGGALVVLVGFLDAWHELGLPMDVTVYASRRPVLDAVAAARPEVRVVPFAEGMSPAGHFAMQSLRLGRLIRDGGAEVVHTTNAMVPRCSLPQLVHHQNLYRLLAREPDRRFLERGLAGRIRDRLTIHALRRAPANVYISGYMRDCAELLVPESAPRNHVIYNGVGEHVVRRLAAIDTSVRPRPPHLVAIQSNAAHKDNPTLLRALAALVARSPEVPWRLTITGDPHWTRERELARELGVAERIDFRGYLSFDELAGLLADALCLVFPSRLEGFGIPLIEAMACGCPVVAADATAVPEVVAGAGILAEPGNPAAFAAAVRRIQEDPALAATLVAKGVERARDFSWWKSARTMHDILVRIAGRRPPSGP